MSHPSHGTPVVYRIAPRRLHQHLFSVELLISSPGSEPVVLSMPAWIPGSYMIRDFARNLVRISAEDGEGRQLVLSKLDKQTWQCAAADRISLRYEVFAWDLSVRAAYLDQVRGYFNGPSLLLRVHGLEDLPCTVELVRPEMPECSEWCVASSLRPHEVDSSGFGLYRADSYADVIDHPVEMGRFRELSFAVGGVPHRMAISGRCRVDEATLRCDLERICTQHAALFRELPIDRYLFLVMALGEGYGGLEHRFSTSLMCARTELPGADSDADSAGYRRFLGLCSHEYFHLWQVKRIRPRAFIEGGLDREVHTRLLWAFEGITSYYDELALVRSGCIDDKTYLGMLAETITRVMRNPGRLVQTLAESSFDAWTKFYKQDENAPNAIVSYYAKGALVALALDLLIRRETGDAQSLDDVMRALWDAHGKSGVGVSEHGVEELAMRVTGLDLTAFFAQALDSTRDLELSELLASVGVGMRFRPRQGAKDLGGCVECFEPVAATPCLDLRLRPGLTEAAVQSVIAGGAGELAGIAPGDVVIAVDGLRATAENLDDLVARAASGAGEVELHLFRRDELMRLTAHPQPTPADTCELMLQEAAPASVVRARTAWLASVA